MCIMECCVCLEEMTTFDGVNFTENQRCKSTHLVCIKCYVQIDRCPMCRYTPYTVPDRDGSQMLRRLRNRKDTPIEKINFLRTCLKNITLF